MMRQATSASTPSTSVTEAVTIENPGASNRREGQPQTLVLRLNRKKKVTWKPGTVDNEFMQKKSSKKCCIFHKEKSFDEDDSDDQNDHHHHHRLDEDHKSEGASSCGDRSGC